MIPSFEDDLRLKSLIPAIVSCAPIVTKIYTPCLSANCVFSLTLTCCFALYSSIWYTRLPLSTFFSHATSRFPPAQGVLILVWLEMTCRPKYVYQLSVTIWLYRTA